MSVLLEDIVQSIELWLRLLRKTPQPYVDPELDPVLLIPGVAGSILKVVDHENGRDERVWVRILGADYKFRTKLWSRFDPSTGRTVTLDSKTSVVVPEDRHGLYAIDTLDPDMIIGRECAYYFHDMIEEMIRWGFQEGTTLFGFGYDFRQSNRLQDTLDHLAKKLESVYNASGGKKINVITHSMGGLLVKCFMCLHADIFEKFVKNWIVIAAPFQGAPGYVSSTFLNGMSFVDGWEQNFFISKWSMHQLLIECPSIYELMPSRDFNWEHIPLLEIWKEKQDSDGQIGAILESYDPEGSIEIFKEALSSNTVNYEGQEISLPFNLDILRWADETLNLLCHAKLPSQVKFYNIYGTSLDTPHTVCYGSEKNPVTDMQKMRYFEPTYVCVDGDGTVPVESAKADGFDAEARVGVPGEHRGILCDHRVFCILKTWLKAGPPDPFYDPINDYVILSTSFEMETRHHQEQDLQVASLKEGWELISDDQIEANEKTDKKLKVSSMAVLQAGKHEASKEGLVQHLPFIRRANVSVCDLNALSLSVHAQR